MLRIMIAQRTLSAGVVNLSANASLRHRVYKFVKKCFHLGHGVFKTCRYDKGKKGRAPPCAYLSDLFLPLFFFNPFCEKTVA